MIQKVDDHQLPDQSLPVRSCMFIVNDFTGVFQREWHITWCYITSQSTQFILVYSNKQSLAFASLYSSVLDSDVFVSVSRPQTNHQSHFSFVFNQDLLVKTIWMQDNGWEKRGTTAARQKKVMKPWCIYRSVEEGRRRNGERERAM